jgi:LmbE family N-acetylglucosaminyl deacetylase
MLTEAVFNAGLRRYDTGSAVGSNKRVAGTEPWRPQWICYYFINDSAPPSFLVDVSDHYDVKRRALECHVSQFRAEATGSVRTRLTSPLFQQLVESRDAQFGALAGVAFAEGIVVKEPIMRSDLFKL